MPTPTTGRNSNDQDRESRFHRRPIANNSIFAFVTPLTAFWCELCNSYQLPTFEDIGSGDIGSSRLADLNTRLKQLLLQASTETDPEKYDELCAEIWRVLQEKDRILGEPSS